jgi:hypothetical protein
LKEQLKNSDLFANDKNKDKTINDFVDKLVGGVLMKKAREAGISIEKILKMSDQTMNLYRNRIRSRK